MKTIHVFGDSHASSIHSHWGHIRIPNIIIKCNHLAGKLMYTFGRLGTNLLNIKNLSNFIDKIELEVKISNKDVVLIQAFDDEKNYSESAVLTIKTGELVHEITKNIKLEEKEKDISFYSCKNINQNT